MITVTEKHMFESHRYPSNCLIFEDNVFTTSGSECYVTDLEDYTILSDFDITEYIEPDAQTQKRNSKGSPIDRRSGKCVPRRIRLKKQNNWINVAHIPNLSRPVITRNRLRDRVYSGQILAYHYKECSIEGNRCIYYGFVPTLNLKSIQRGVGYGKLDMGITVNNDAAAADGNNSDDDAAAANDADDNIFETRSFYGAHVTLQINVQHVWPRKLYVHLKRDCACSCNTKCVRVSVLTLNDVSATTSARDAILPKTTYCLKQIPWESVYVIMGNINKNTIEGHKEHRMCKTCAQCRKCINSPVFCRDHKRCKHEKTTVDLSSFNMSLGIPKIKKCRKII